jgi:hypothetical protein
LHGHARSGFGRALAHGVERGHGGFLSGGVVRHTSLRGRRRAVCSLAHSAPNASPRRYRALHAASVGNSKVTKTIIRYRSFYRNFQKNFLLRLDFLVSIAQVRAPQANTIHFRLACSLLWENDYFYLNKHDWMFFV